MDKPGKSRDEIAAEEYELSVRPKSAGYYSQNETKRDYLAGRESRSAEVECPRCSDLYYHPKTLIESEKQRAADWEDIAKRNEAKLAEQAAEIARLKRVGLKLAQQVAERGGAVDHACKECFPHGKIVQDGFRCAYHEALAPQAKEEEK